MSWEDGREIQMKSRLTIRLAAAFFGVVLLGSAVSAVGVTNTADQGQYVGWCDSSCHGSVTQVLDDTYPAYQPLQVCDVECVWY
jgi:hypothetical protein